jgi:hypothetical protein
MKFWKEMDYWRKKRWMDDFLIAFAALCGLIVGALFVIVMAVTEGGCPERPHMAVPPSTPPSAPSPMHYVVPDSRV